jgi:hypothetical protein
MTAESLALYAGAVLSLLFGYFPGLKGWFEGLGTEYKRLIMAGLLLAVSGAIFGLSCWKVVDPLVTCDQAGLVGLVKVFVLALIANQAMFTLTKG